MSNTPRLKEQSSPEQIKALINNTTIIISEWVMDDDATHSQLTHDHINNEHMLPTTPSTSRPLPANTPHTSELPILHIPNNAESNHVSTKSK